MSRTSIHDLLAEARARLRRVTPPEAAAAQRGGATLVDLRAEDHVARDGAIPGALRFPRNVLEWRLDPDSPWRGEGAPGLDDQVILFCDHGYQSSLAAAQLHDMGFEHATDLDGGFEAWVAAGLPVQRG